MSSSSNSSSLNSSSLNSSSLPSFYQCVDSGTSVNVVASWALVNGALMLPLSCLVLHLGCRRSATATASHTDVFTLNMAVMELICCLGSMLYCVGCYAALQWLTMTGINLCFVGLPARPFLHCLTCGERYLAVVHPITYRGLCGARGRVGTRLRNGAMACAWLACAGWLGLMSLHSPDFPSGYFLGYIIAILLVTSFFSLSVLRALAGLRPGEGGEGERVCQSKRRAFHTVTAILATLLLKTMGGLWCLSVSMVVSYHEACLAISAALWLYLPSSLVLPGLYLHRAGKIPGCRG